MKEKVLWRKSLKAFDELDLISNDPMTVYYQKKDGSEQLGHDIDLKTCNIEKEIVFFQQVKAETVNLLLIIDNSGKSIHYS